VKNAHKTSYLSLRPRAPPPPFQKQNQRARRLQCHQSQLDTFKNAQQTFPCRL
jgi:hypothetical protein